MDIKNFKKVLIELGQVLSASEKVQRLVIDNTPMALENDNFIALTFDELVSGKYFSFTPTEHAINSLDKNTFITLVFNNCDLEHYMTGSIYIGTSEETLMLTKNRFRLLELVDVVVQCLQGRKISTAGVVDIRYFSDVTYTEFITGYKIPFTVRDQRDERAEL